MEKELYVENSKYEILTPHGWEPFKGVIKNSYMKPKESIVITTENNFEITVTNNHRINSNNEYIRADTLKINDYINTSEGLQKIIHLEHVFLEESFDIVETISHTILANNINVSQSDELSSVPKNISEAFLSGILPVLATGGDCIITSTPGSDEDEFAKLWKGAIDNTDENGNETNTGVGRNGFHPEFIPWYMHPERDEEWAKPFRAQLGEIGFAREMECVVGDTKVHIEGLQGLNVKMSIGDLYDILKMTQDFNNKN